MAIQARNSEMVSLLSADFIQKQDSAYLAGIVAGSILTLPGLVAFWPGQVALNDNRVPLGLSSLYDLVNERLGIGTATPGYRLHVVGDNSTTFALVKLENTATNGHDYWLYAGQDSTGFGIYDETSGAYMLTINDAGYVNLNRLGAAWTALSYGSGWANFSGSFQAGAYKRFGDMVWLRGLVKRSSGTGTAIATLPSGYRPSSICRFAVDTDSGHGAIEVSTAGVIDHKSGGTGFVQLEGLIFSVL